MLKNFVFHKGKFTPTALEIIINKFKQISLFHKILKKFKQNKNFINEKLFLRAL